MEQYKVSLTHKAIILILLVLQIAIWFTTKNILPTLTILEHPPSSIEAKINSFNEDQFYFRWASLMLQNSGDSFGRFTALREYDYSILLKWLQFLDTLDNNSNFVPAIASYYYSNTQNTEDNKYLIIYLEDRYNAKPRENWWWMMQAIQIASHKMNNKRLALRLAYKLAQDHNPDLPIWVRQMPAFILEQIGQKQEAIKIIQNILNNYHNYSAEERNFMNYFIKERLQKFTEEAY